MHRGIEHVEVIKRHYKYVDKYKLTVSNVVPALLKEDLYFNDEAWLRELWAIPGMLTLEECKGVKQIGEGAWGEDGWKDAMQNA